MNDWGAFEPQPVLADDAVRLRPLTQDDFPALFAVASDPLIWELHPAVDRWQEPVFRQFFAEALAGGGALAVEEAASGRIIGSSRYDRTRVEPGEVEIGWTFLARDHWGGATNRRVKRLMIYHALMHFDQAVFYVGADNRRSRRAMEKIGGILLDGRTIDFTMAGAPATHVVYAIRDSLA